MQAFNDNFSILYKTSIHIVFNRISTKIYKKCSRQIREHFNFVLLDKRIIIKYIVIS